MARFGFSWNNEREFFDNPATAIVDPTSISIDPHIDGSLVTRPTAGSGKSQIHLTAPKYQFIANGFYQGPWGSTSAPICSSARDSPRSFTP